MRADACAKNLVDKDFRAFWRNFSKHNNAMATNFVNTINRCSGEDNIAEMWRTHFEQLYNSVDDGGFRTSFYERLHNVSDINSNPCVITVHDVLDGIRKQKTGKAVGLHNIAMEAVINGGFKLAIHLTLLFNMFIKFHYLPTTFMQSVVIPLVKAKSGNLSDVNNYRAIAISTSLSKLFECVIVKDVIVINISSVLKVAILQDFVQMCLKTLLTTTLTGAAMFLPVSLILPRPLIVSTTGNYFINY